MKLLLDTHTFLWSVSEAELLSDTARALIEDSANELYLSIASLWKATIKITLGKLRVPGGTVDFLIEQMNQSGVQVLPVSLPHLSRLQSLPLLHRDPFDRLLAAQSQAEQMPLVSVDKDIRLYGATCLW